MTSMLRGNGNHKKAPENWRTPKPGGLRSRFPIREASWTAVVLYRFLTVAASQTGRRFPGFLSQPLAVAVLRGFHYLAGNCHVLGDLEIEHSDSGEIRSVIEGMLQAGLGPDGSSGEHFVGYPGPPHLGHV